MSLPRVGTTTSNAAPAADAPLLQYGAQGTAVEKLQQQLKQAGYPLQVDGDWGSKTEAAVRDFQKKNGLAVDGIVGPKTAHALSRASAMSAPATSAAPATGSSLRDQLSTVDSPLSRAIGYAEGNRTADGAKTAHYGGHRDPVNQHRNVGNFSLQHNAAGPAEADQIQLANLRSVLPAYQDACKRAGLDPNHPLLAATFFDLYNQAPNAATANGGFLDQLPKLKQQGLSPETLTKARLESWRDPATGQLDHSFKTDQALIADQRRRMGLLTEVAGQTTPVASGKLGLGSQGSDVKELKQLLKDAGFYHGPVNDTLGKQGVEALKQAKTALGIAGPADQAGADTIARLKEHVAGGTKVNVPFISQFDRQVPGDYRGQSANLKCDNACELMMAKAGTRAGTSNEHVTAFHNGGAAEAGFQYLEQQLNAGHPVMIGVRHPDGSAGSSNVNGINHYLVATGVGTDGQGRRFIQFHDPAQTTAAAGRDTNPENRLYLDNGRFRQDATGPHGHDPYELRGVVRNLS